MKMKGRLLIICLAVVALCLSASANAWQYSNQWRSPTRNIACRYHAVREYLRCETENDAFSVAIVRNSGRAFRARFEVIPYYRTPILQYGERWKAPGFLCFSRVSGMTCWSGGHGFFINATRYRLW